MKNILKIIIRCCLFAAVFIFIFSSLSVYIRRPDDEADEMHAFYSEPENSIDVLFMGSSPILRGVSPMVMWNEEGFTSYVRASALQAPAVTYGVLKESLKYQAPKVVVLLCDNIFLEYDYTEQEGDLRRSMDGLKISAEKLEIIRHIVSKDERQTVLSYLFPLFRYHDRWKEIDWLNDEPNYLLEHSFKKGNVYLRGGEPREYPDNFMEPTGEDAPAFNDEAREYIEKMVSLCTERDIPVVILHLPKMSWSYEQSMALEAFAEEMGTVYIDLDREEYRQQLDLDTAADYYDQGHMNLNGSIKVSRWLGEYLDETYDLPDHSDDEAYSLWHEDYKLYAEKTGF